MKFRGSLFVLIILQFLTAFFHSLSFFSKPVPSNDTEKQLIDLFTTYKQDLGLGIHRSTYDLFIAMSSCFTLICVLAAMINVYFLRNNLEHRLWGGLLRIQAIVFGIVCIIMIRFTFLPPIVCTAAIGVAALVAYFISSKHTLET